MRKVTQFFKRGNKKFLFRPLNIFTWKSAFPNWKKTKKNYRVFADRSVHTHTPFKGGLVKHK